MCLMNLPRSDRCGDEEEEIVDLHFCQLARSPADNGFVSCSATIGSKDESTFPIGMVAHVQSSMFDMASYRK